VELIIEILKALLTPAIAAFAVWIAWRQHRTNEDKIRLELFERRMAVYEETKGLFKSFWASWRMDFDEIDTFFRHTAGSVFLFREDVTSYLEEVRGTALNLAAISSELDGAQALDEREKYRDDAKASRAEMRRLSDRLEQVFLPYLGFHNRNG